MRTSMVPSMLNMLAYNLNRGSDNVRLFEAGNVFEASGEKSVELKRISMRRDRAAWMRMWCAELVPRAAARPLSFFDLKGDVEDLLAPFSHWTLYYDAQTADYYHPGRSARAVHGWRDRRAVWPDSSRCGRGAQAEAGCFCRRDLSRPALSARSAPGAL